MLGVVSPAAAQEAVYVDIKPQSCPNPLNTNSRGVLPVAILGTASLDVTTIDVASLLLEGVAPVGDSIEDVATPFDPIEPCDCDTLGPDGYLDLTLKFKTQDIVAALGAVSDGDVIMLTLTGTGIMGQDCVIIKKKK
jgi:hypothetical protein